jgi:hypothetical protein
LIVGEDDDVLQFGQGLAVRISKANRMPFSSAAYTVLWVSVELGVDRVTAAAPICPLIPLSSVKMQVVCASLQQLLCCNIASSAVSAMKTGGGFHQGAMMYGRRCSKLL